MAPWTLSGTTRVSWYQKDKTKLELLKQEIVSGSDISWVIRKYAPRLRQITMPASQHSGFFTSRMPVLPPNQQHQSTESAQFSNYALQSRIIIFFANL